MPSTILTIDGVDYDNVDRPAARVRIDELQKVLDGGYDTCSFSEICGHPLPTWHGGQPVAVTWVSDDASSRVIFAGTIGDVSHNQAQTGWIISYQAISKKHLCDNVPVTGFDQTGVMVFNRSPEDLYYTASEAGLSVGEIITFALCVEATATALDAVGVGNYTSLSPPTLPAATVADLALLTIVPPQQVILQGEGILNQVENLVQHWMPRFCAELQADGTIRCKDTADTVALGTFAPVTVILPNATVLADPVTWPTIRKSTARCATRVVIRGAAEVEAVMLSTLDGTLAEVWTSTEEDDWTYSDFTSPKDAYSEGTITGMTGNSATVDPTDATRAWGVNFWSGREAWIYGTKTLGTGLAIHFSRPVTSNTACTAGGTSTITWDASWPADNGEYTTYRLVGGAGGNNSVGRLYTVREPATGDVGLATYVGSHLVRRSPLPIKWGNNSNWRAVFYPAGIVSWTDPDSGLYNDFPMDLEVIPAAGQFNFYQPVVVPFSGGAHNLELGYPTTADEGLPRDVRILALYSRGTLTAIVPPNTGVDLDVPAYEGTAYTVDGMQVTKVIDLPSWSAKGDLANMQLLAQQQLDSLKDAVYEGGFDWYGVPPWDWWDFGTCVNFSVPPLTGLWEDINAPIRSVRITWPQGEGMIHKVSIGFSNQRRPYAGDDLYMPAAFSGESGVDFGNFLDQSSTIAGRRQGDVNSFLGSFGDATSSALGSFKEAMGDSLGSFKEASTSALGSFNDARTGAMDSFRDAHRGGGEDLANNPATAAAYEAVSNTMNNAAQAVSGGPGQDGGEQSGGMPTFPGDPLLDAQGRGERPARPRGEARSDEENAAKKREMTERGQAERGRMDRGEAPPERPFHPLSPHAASEDEQAASRRGRDERGRLDRGEAPPQRPDATLPPRAEPTPGEQAQSDRGQAERGRLDRGEAPPKRPEVSLPPAPEPTASEQAMINRGQAEQERLRQLREGG